MKREEFEKKWIPKITGSVKEFLEDLDSLFPPAEGAEEIIRKKLNLGKTFNASQYPREMFAIEVGEMLEMMQEFAALNAGKMVEEKLREELIKYERFAGCEYGTVKDTEDFIDAYLKSREQ